MMLYLSVQPRRSLLVPAEKAPTLISHTDGRRTGKDMKAAGRAWGAGRSAAYACDSAPSARKPLPTASCMVLDGGCPQVTCRSKQRHPGLVATSNQCQQVKNGSWGYSPTVSAVLQVGAGGVGTLVPARLQDQPTW